MKEISLNIKKSLRVQTDSLSFTFPSSDSKTFSSISVETILPPPSPLDLAATSESKPTPAPSSMIFRELLRGAGDAMK